MTKQKRWQRIGALFDIPDDIIMNTVRVTMVGRGELLIENHSGIIEYTSELLRVKVSDGEICVSGSELSLAVIESEQVRVGGMVAAVRYV
ncbi:MAG: sporulation protein YqfC [Selenomonadales bacterium]|nr:sporulation protein YqfC [Selenomonadales bacterium]